MEPDKLKILAVDLFHEDELRKASKTANEIVSVLRDLARGERVYIVRAMEILETLEERYVFMMPIPKGMTVDQYDELIQARLNVFIEAEREACAKIADENVLPLDEKYEHYHDRTADEAANSRARWIAGAIRARGKKL